MAIPPKDLHFSMPNLRYVLGSDGVAISGQDNVDELLRTMAGFSRRSEKDWQTVAREL